MPKIDDMTFDQALSHFGTIPDMALALGVKSPSIYEWKRDGAIPETRQYQIELATKGRLKADFPALRIGRKAA